MIRGISFSSNRVSHHQKTQRHTVADFSSELKASGIPSEVIAQGLSAVQEYADAHGITLPKELSSSSENQVEEQPGIEAVSSNVEENKEEILKENLDSSDMNSKESGITYSAKDKFKGMNQLSDLNKHFLVNNNFNKKEY